MRGYEADAASAWAKSVALKFMLSVRAEGVFVRVMWGRVVDAVDWEGMVVRSCGIIGV